jgi:uncharacterized protein YjaZ
LIKTDQPLEETETYIRLVQEFAKEIQRPFEESERAFLKWLADEHDQRTVSRGVWSG